MAFLVFLLESWGTAGRLPFYAYPPPNLNLFPDPPLMAAHAVFYLPDFVCVAKEWCYSLVCVNDDRFFKASQFAGIKNRTEWI